MIQPMIQYALNMAIAMMAIFLVAKEIQPNTVEVYGIEDSSSIPTIALTPLKIHNDTVCLANNLYHEARGEGTKGMIAVANVTVNRAKAKERSVCDVVYAPKQYSWTHQPQGEVIKDLDMYKTATHLADMALNYDKFPKLVGNADHYHAKSVKPYWAKQFKKVKEVNNHVFYDSNVKPVPVKLVKDTPNKGRNVNVNAKPTASTTTPKPSDKPVKATTKLASN